MKEVFKVIPNYEGHYEISNLGRVRSIPREIVRRDGFLRRVGEKFLEPSIQRIPYGEKYYTTAVFCLRKDLKTELIPAVHCVLSAFYDEYEVGTHKVVYKDGNRLNLDINNLKFDFWDGRYGGRVEVKMRGKKAQKFRSIAQAGKALNFDHTKLFEKEVPDNMKGLKISFSKDFKRKGKKISEIIL
jgi:hypothetical protein